jgi:hypothetical protein
VAIKKTGKVPPAAGNGLRRFLTELLSEISETPHCLFHFRPPVGLRRTDILRMSNKLLRVGDIRKVWYGGPVARALRALAD